MSYELFFEGDLDEHFDSKKPVDSSAALHEIEAEFNEQIHPVASGLIRRTQADHSDIFGMGEMIRARHPGYWKQHIHGKNDWEDIYSGITVEVKLHMHLQRVGLKDR
ncbi:hypothetical protein D3C73_1426370 [compost metagenome]